jgi:GR25 family glycosyltransferase involved in LPS biosynthesis
MSCNTYMSYTTYVINMADSIKRWDQISKHLDDIGINYSRFDAINGNNIENKYDEYLTFAKHITPNSVIGCGLSHFLAAKQHFENNDNIAMILEDDAVPMFNDKNVIHNVIESAPKDWEIILLYAQGITNYRNNTWEITTKFASGSSAAYLINKKGYQKRYNNGNYKLFTHTDCERSMYDVNVYKTPNPIFMPCDTLGSSCNVESSSTSNIYSNNIFDSITDSLYFDDIETNITGYKGNQIFRYNIIKIPGTNINLDTIRLLMIIVPLIAVITTYYSKSKSNYISFLIFISFFSIFAILIFVKSIFKIIGAT